MRFEPHRAIALHIDEIPCCGRSVAARRQQLRPGAQGRGGAAQRHDAGGLSDEFGDLRRGIRIEARQHLQERRQSLADQGKIGARLQVRPRASVTSGPAAMTRAPPRRAAAIISQAARRMVPRHILLRKLKLSS